MKIGKFIIFGVGVVCGYKYHDKIENKINDISDKIVERIRYKAADAIKNAIKNAINKTICPEDDNKTHGYCHDHEYHPNCRTKTRYSYEDYSNVFSQDESNVYINFASFDDAMKMVEFITDKIHTYGNCSKAEILTNLGRTPNYLANQFGFTTPSFEIDFDGDIYKLKINNFVKL